jgi:hypothetical protein
VPARWQKSYGLDENEAKLVDVLEAADREVLGMLLNGGGLLSIHRGHYNPDEVVQDLVHRLMPETIALEKLLNANESEDPSADAMAIRLDYTRTAYCLGLAVGFRLGGAR